MHAGNLAAEGQQFALDPLTAKAKHPSWAAGYMFIMAVTMATAIAVHVLLIMLWKALKWTRDTPVPDFLLFPVPELLLANVMVMPLALVSTVLLIQVGSASSLALGAVGTLVLLGYLSFVASVLMAVAVRREMLGLRFVQAQQKRQQQEEAAAAAQQAPKPGPDDRQQEPALDRDSAGSGEPILAQVSKAEPAVGEQQQEQQPSAREQMLLRLAPFHVAGYWEMPDLERQALLRRTYQGEQQAGVGPAPHLAINLWAQPVVAAALSQTLTAAMPAHRERACPGVAGVAAVEVQVHQHTTGGGGGGAGHRRG